ncbi:MAG: PilZ domain-containing protein [Sphingomonadaceae bacterium]
MIARKTFGKLGNRDGARLALEVAAELDLPHRTLYCAFEDVSRSGVRLSVSPPPRVGTPAILRFDGIEAMGSIVWARSNACALRFDRPLTPHHMERLQSVASDPESYERSRARGFSTNWR